MFHQLNAFNVKQWVWNMFLLQEVSCEYLMHVKAT